MGRKRAKRAINVSQRTLRRASLAQGRLRHFARLAQIAFGFAQARLSRRRERLFGMTNQTLHHYQIVCDEQLYGRP
jgi:hypothetical protein